MWVEDVWFVFVDVFFVFAIEVAMRGEWFVYLLCCCVWGWDGLWWVGLNLDEEGGGGDLLIDDGDVVDWELFDVLRRF